jgi:hypothetical protein
MREKDCRGEIERKVGAFPATKAEDSYPISVEPTVNIYFPHQLVLCPKTEKLSTEEERF